jgi:hypothetical protein
MMYSQHDPLGKLAILRREDHFRDWQSLDDKRVCLLCHQEFVGHEAIISRQSGDYELRCPTRGCQSHVHQWVYPDQALVSEKAYANWWRALGEEKGAPAL